MTRLMLVVGALTSALSGAAELNDLKGLEVQETSAGARVVVTGSSAPVFSVVRLNGPDRLVVDVQNANCAAIKGNHDGAGPATGVVASQFNDGEAHVGRLLIGLEGVEKYDVRAEDNRLVVSVDRAHGQAPAISATEPRGDGVVSSQVDEQPVKHPATHLKGLSLTEKELKLTADGQIARFELLELENPPRLALDLFGLTGQVRAPHAHSALVRDVRVGGYADKTRIVLEASGPMFGFKASRTTNGLVVSLSGVHAPSAPVAVEERPVIDTGRVAQLQSVDFREASGGGQLELGLLGEARFSVERPDVRSAVLTLDGVQVPRSLEKTLDTSALETPVRMISTFAVPGAGQRVRVVISSATPIDETMVPRTGGFTWKIRTKGSGEQAVAETQTAGFSTAAIDYAADGAPERARYVGKKVSFEFKDIDIHNLLRIIAEVSKKNIVVADDVAGRVTIRLRNVPWDQAFELILKSKNLGSEEVGNIMRVAPMATLVAEAEAAAKRRKDRIDSAETTVQLMPVNYAGASEMATRAKDVLTTRGNVSVDSRTNTLIVRDLPENMSRIRAMIASLDTPTPQVLIESRIVEASTRFAREVGVQWGGQGVMSPSTGNPTGLAFPNSVALTGGAGTGNSIGTSTTPNYAVSLPVGAGDGSGGALGMVFGSAGGALQLNLRLSALESQGQVKTISAPRITTMDNVSATISQGVSIPFSQVSAAGANTTFVSAKLSLNVTPHITQDGSVMMKVEAQNNSPDPSNSGSNGQPGIAQKEASTTVMVKDGETTVIGGIYTRQGSNSQNGLPILSKIPVIGFFFRNFKELETKQELLVFITPRILNRQAVAQTP